MESARKRKASQATPSASDGSATKKLKLLNSNQVSSSKSKIQEVGYKVVEQLKRAQDKSGQRIATDFLELPHRDELPDYYEFTKLPVAIETIEAKIKQNGYPSISAIESDFKRMVQNAKDYNDPHSAIYDNAEKIRKLIFNFMKNHNPAYVEQPGYSAVPTPIPEALLAGTPAGNRRADRSNGRTPGSASAKKNRRETVAEAPPAKKAVVEPAVTKDVEMEDANEAAAKNEEEEDDAAVEVDFTGKTFQEAQQMVLTYLLEYTDDDEGLQIYQPFANLPSRKLEDYYKLIRRPVCIRGVMKRARGQHGRDPPTGITDFKTWDALEEEVSYIWRNAKEYNEDGSEMFNLAADFEGHFKSLLTEAKSKVDEPLAVKLKLGAPKPKVTLNLASHRKSASPGPVATESTKSESNQRSNHVQSVTANGSSHSKQPTPSTATPRPTTAEPVRPATSANSGSPPGGSIKGEKAHTQSPALNGISSSHVIAVNGSMPPPAGRPSSGSPFTAPQTTINGTANSMHFTTPSALPPTKLRNYPLEAALLPLLTINTHPHLQVKPPFRLSLTPHATLAEQSATLTIPSSHYYVQIAPTISKPLAMGRPYKLFVALNGTRLTQRDTHFHADNGRRTHVYEGSFAHGVNRIEVEIVAAAATPTEQKIEGASAEGRSNGLDVEKVVVFAHMTR